MKGKCKEGSTVSIDELKQILKDTNLHNEEPEKKIVQASYLIKAFLFKQEPEYAKAVGYMIKVVHTTAVA